MWSHLLASVFYLHNLIFSELSSINCVAWSLEVEVQFYILAPLLAMMIFSIRPANLRRCLLLGSIFAASIGSEFIFQHHITLRLTLINFIQYFLSGFLVADIYLLEWGQSPSTRYGSDLVTLTALVALFTYRIFAPACGMLLIPWLVILVIMGAFRGIIFNKIFTNQWLYTIGGMCYTIYLYHYIVIGFLGHGRFFLFKSFIPDLMLSFIFIPFLILCISSVLFMIFEKPFMRRDWYVKWINLLKCNSLGLF